MTTDCAWTQSKTEAYFAEDLGTEDLNRFQNHLSGCAECHRQVQEIQDIDPLVQQVFQHRVAQAGRAARWNTRPRVMRLALAGATVALIGAIGIGFALRPEPVAPPSAINHKQEMPPEQSAPGIPKKSNGSIVDPKLGKPGDQQPAAVASQPTLDAPKADAPAFSIIDAAGYSATLETYKGHVLLLGVISPEQKEAVTNLEDLYKKFGKNPAMRVACVASHRADKFESSPCPIIFYNNGSQLLNVKAGDFLLLDRNGARRLGGSLAKDASKVEAQIEQLVIQ